MQSSCWLLAMGLVLSAAVLVQHTQDVTAGEPALETPMNGIQLSASNQDISNPIPDVTLSLRNLNDEHVTSVLIGSFVQLVLTTEIKPMTQVPSESMLLPWSCRAVSQHGDSKEERYILLNGCGDGHVIPDESGFLYSPWWQLTESTRAARSEFFPMFNLRTRHSMRFECELLTATDSLNDRSCVRPESRRMHLQRRRKRSETQRGKGSLPSAHTLPIKMLPHLPGKVFRDDPYLETHYYAQNYGSDRKTTRRTTTTTTTTTPKPTMTTTTATTTTTTTTSPTTTTTADRTTPKVILRNVIINEPDVHAAQEPDRFMASVMTSPLIMGLLVGLGALMFILLIVAIPTAFLCCRMLRTSMEKDTGSYPYPTYMPISPVRYEQNPVMAMFQSPLGGGGRAQATRQQNQVQAMQPAQTQVQPQAQAQARPQTQVQPAEAQNVNISYMG